MKKLTTLLCATALTTTAFADSTPPAPTAITVPAGYLKMVDAQQKLGYLPTLVDSAPRDDAGCSTYHHEYCVLYKYEARNNGAWCDYTYYYQNLLNGLTWVSMVEKNIQSDTFGGKRIYSAIYSDSMKYTVVDYKLWQFYLSQASS